jgi:DNA replication ATP-dependent helicase Dna2
MFTCNYYPAKDYNLVWGTPGTGKTHTIAVIIQALVHLKKSVLVTSYTHNAVDNILFKLKKRNVDFLRIGNMDKIHPSLHEHALNAATATTTAQLEAIYMTKPVIATTCLGVNQLVYVMSLIMFTAVL